ncbi:SGNH/GDSL hydrolase family protein [Neolewinella litorea]|uniref:SGNH/GDSL hydrolase family protein n=1 Tax=Neolewinella litorea TaxID=2562452 RepID=A0A4S4NS71_9BACT|nr:SGNH/GDSL hydrolase family protein [Neolewinella litorea]THH41268.1 SGNH/GDSL hydrolase family protein [Neolewinella litorea]
MRHIFLTLFLFLFLTCSKEDATIMGPSGSPPPTAEPDTTISYLALGDSYTIGTSVPAEQRWPEQLARQLLERERIAVEPLEIVARNGWRTDNLANALAAADPGDDFDLVSLLIGVNDQFQGFAVDGYQRRFEQLLQAAIGYAGGDTSRVFVVTIPDYAYTPFGGGREFISREIDQFNAAARQVTTRYDIPFYNITPISRRGLQQPDLVAGDDLHPSGKQYGLWVEEVLLKQVADLIRAGGN